jgi:RimJ/RimL family protein N-acetyltransferase
MPQDADGLIKLIDSLYPWFFLVFKDNKLMAFIYCYNWLGREGKFHSCFLTAAATREAYGSDTRKILTLFCNYLYEAMGLVKVRAEVNRENALCIKLLETCRFKKEGFLKCSVLRNGKPQDTLIYGKINPIILRGKKNEI